ncbi:MAG TPA: hypothetical protein VFY87_06655 [Geminicoccaceae bacterium]|nr:hypothetical protein [Geminicoccaceae bacterium]
MSDGFGIRNLTVNLGTADRPAAHICLLGTQICIGPTLCFQLTVPHSPACCHFVLTNCRHCVTHFATHGCWYLQSCPFASCPHLSVLPCGPISPFEGCGFGSPVINDPRGQVVNPAVDFASLKAQLRAAMAQLEEQEKL